MLLFLLKITSITLIHFHPENQEIKHRSQVKQSNTFLQEAFPGSTSTARFFSQSKMHVYQYKENDRVIANLFVENAKYFFNDNSANLLIDPKKVNVLEIYSVVVDKDYRKKGLAGKLMRDAIDSMIKLYNLPKNTLIGLHLNPIDQMMGISFAFYCSLGFNKASIVEIGPNDFQFKAEKIFKLKSPVELAYDILKGKIIGKYFAMFVEADKLKKVQVDMQVLVKIGKILQKLMLQVADNDKEFL